MRTYGQYCPIARGAEIFAERWTPVIIRNLYLGCGSFGELLEGAPGLSRTLLSERLKQLERLRIVESAPKPRGCGGHYQLTPAGHDLFKVCASLGEWGARWLEIQSRITLRLRGHLVARGVVTIPDGTDECVNRRQVKIQRRSTGKWRRVAITGTNSDGFYRVRLQDLEGRYRAVVKKNKRGRLNLLCAQDVSRVRTHRHIE